MAFRRIQEAIRAKKVRIPPPPEETRPPLAPINRPQLTQDQDRKRYKREAETKALWEQWNAQSERQRQHERQMLAASLPAPTNADRALTGLKWVCGTVAAVFILPVAVATAGVEATSGAFTAGVDAIARAS